MKTLIKIKKSEFQKLYNLACTDWKAKFRVKFESFIFEDYINFEEDFLDEIQKACTEEQSKVFNEIFKDYLKIKVNLFNITTYKDVCKALDEKLITEDTFSHLPSYMITRAVAQAKIQQLEKLFNGDWKKDWNNSNQYKWYPYFDKRSGCWVFFGSFYDGTFFFCGRVGCYKDQATSNHIGKNFMDIYIQTS